MSHLRTELSETEFWSLVDHHLHNDYRKYCLVGNQRTSKQSIKALLADKTETVGRVLVKLIKDEDLRLDRITLDDSFNLITLWDKVTFDDAFDLITRWLEELASRLSVGLDEDEEDIDADEDFGNRYW